MLFVIRPYRVPADFPAKAELNKLIEPEPPTIEEMVETERSIPEGTTLYRVVAEDAEGQMAGYASAVRMPWTPQGRFYVWVSTHPAFRLKGVGAALYAHIEEYIRSQGGTDLRCEVRDNQPETLAFAQRRGFVTDRHLFESTLDVAAFDPAPFAGVVEQVESSGIRFFTLADDSTEVTRHQFYETVRDVSCDIPGYDERFPTYPEFCRLMLDVPNLRPDCQIIAADGDRFVGATRMAHLAETGALVTYFTGVRREYRGRRIALALKLLAVETARHLGVPYMRTNNDSTNGPMLAVNRKLGYQPSPGEYLMKKLLR